MGEDSLPKEHGTARLHLGFKNSALRNFSVLEHNVSCVFQTGETSMLTEPDYRLETMAGYSKRESSSTSGKQKPGRS